MSQFINDKELILPAIFTLHFIFLIFDMLALHQVIYTNRRFASIFLCLEAEVYTMVKTCSTHSSGNNLSKMNMKLTLATIKTTKEPMVPPKASPSTLLASIPIEKSVENITNKSELFKNLKILQDSINNKDNFYKACLKAENIIGFKVASGPPYLQEQLVQHLAEMEAHIECQKDYFEKRLQALNPNFKYDKAITEMSNRIKEINKKTKENNQVTQQHL